MGLLSNLDKWYNFSVNVFIADVRYYLEFFILLTFALNEIINSGFELFESRLMDTDLSSRNDSYFEHRDQTEIVSKTKNKGNIFLYQEVGATLLVKSASGMGLNGIHLDSHF